MQLLNSWAQYSLDNFIDLLNNSDQVLTKYQVSVQWVLILFLQTKPAPVDVYLFLASLSPFLPSPGCLLVHSYVTCKWQRFMYEPEACMMLDSKSFWRLNLWANWRAKGVVLIVTFFCIIYRSFWLSMLVPSFFTCSCTHVLLLSMVQQRQANPMLLLCSKFTCFKLVFVDLWLVL